MYLYHYCKRPACKEYTIHVHIVQLQKDTPTTSGHLFFTGRDPACKKCTCMNLHVCTQLYNTCKDSIQISAGHVTVSRSAMHTYMYMLAMYTCICQQDIVIVYKRDFSIHLHTIYYIYK